MCEHANAKRTECEYYFMWDDEQEHTFNAANAIADLLLTMLHDPRDTAQEQAFAYAVRVLDEICNDGAHDGLARTYGPFFDHPTILAITAEEKFQNDEVSK